MDNISFGNYLSELRKKNNMTQRFVAYELEVSDKAVSKWENGASKPDLETIKELATLYNISFEEMLKMSEVKKNVKISKIVLTGGPCAGKTTALSWIQNYFSTRGYKVLFVPETATELISNGVAPWTCGTNYDYQTVQVKLQKFKEQIFEEAALSMNNEKILIVCDRGILDNKAYMTDNEFKRILNRLGLKEAEERDSYDAIFHLVTTAKGAEEAYTLSNNNARKESLEEARELDDRIISCWTGHPHLRVIDNSTDFEKKLERLLKEIALTLGEPEPYEIERKYLIYYPDINKLESMPNCKKIDIVQTYLKNKGDLERRIRARGTNGEYVYYLAEKKDINNRKRVEIEKRLSQEEYFKLLMEADHNLHTICKTRYCLMEKNHCFEIDVYPDWKKQAILEVELNDEEEKVEIPDLFEVIQEVTDDRNYKNYEMAKEMPKEFVKRRNQ